MFRLLAVMAEFERDQISERTKSVLQHKKSKCERVGSIPYGFTLADDRVQLIAHAEEQRMIEKIKTMKSSGKSLREIAAGLTAAGHSPRGKRWYAQTIKNILLANS